MEDIHNYEGDLFEDAYQNKVLETKEQLDQLFSEIEDYRDSKKFKEILDFCARFPYQSAFNAMLLHIQCPGCKFALTANQWKQYPFRRKLVPNARPLIYLNHMPVGTLYDISDTAPIDSNDRRTDEEIIKELANPFETNGTIDERIYKTLLNNLPYHGIAFDENFNAAGTYAAYIKPYQILAPYSYRYRGNEVNLRIRMNYLLSVNQRSSTTEKFISILHELGHFFCHHLPPVNPDWWEKRPLDKCIREFEAEVTSYLVCKRHGFPCPNSVKYLEGYVQDKAQIPLNISIVHILRAVSEIENMLRDMDYKDGLLYKKDHVFNDYITKYNKENLSR